MLERLQKEPEITVSSEQCFEIPGTEEMFQASKETRKFHSFKAKDLFVYAGNKDRQSYKTVIKEEDKAECLKVTEARRSQHMNWKAIVL